MSRFAVFVSCALTLGVVAGCRGLITDPDGRTAETDPPDSEPPPDPFRAECAPTAHLEAGANPIRRLSRIEYEYSVVDLLSFSQLTREEELTLASLPQATVQGFETTAQAPDPTILRSYFDLATLFAERFVSESLTDSLDCDPADGACAYTFISELGRRAFRRPLTDDGAESETERYQTLYRSVKASEDANAAIEAVVAAMLLSPSFLYHAEPVQPDVVDGDLVAIDPYAVASRLSYFFWASAPDEELLEAAASDELSTPEQIEAQARRLFADPRATRGLDSFHHHWLKLEELEDAAFDDALKHDMREETLRFARAVIREGDGLLSTLLTSQQSYVNGPLAEIYGIDAPPTDWEQVELPADRSGILTQPSILAQFGVINPEVHRGLFVRGQLLCDTPPSPPANIPEEDAQFRLSSEPCKNCHIYMDPIGFTLDRYDALGRYRVQDDSGVDISERGEVVASGRIDEPGLAGEIEGAAQLGALLADSERVQRCTTLSWVRQAAARAVTEDDSCAVQRIADVFVESGGDIQALAVAIATAPTFRARSTSDLN